MKTSGNRSASVRAIQVVEQFKTVPTHITTFPVFYREECLEKELTMKTIRFAAVAIAISLLLGTFAPAYGAHKNVAAVDVSSQSSNAAALDLPFVSPFLFAASAPVLAAGGDGPGVDGFNSTAGYSCQLTAQTPADWTVMGRRNIFDAKWTLKNTGTKVWGIHGVDVKFRGGFPVGTKFHTGRDLFDLPKQVGPGQKITLVMDMTAPKNSGNYVDNWGLYLGNLVFCKFYIAITVR
jgi:hypothetical protein